MLKRSWPLTACPQGSPQGRAVSCKNYTVNLAALHVFVYGLAPSGKRLSLKTGNRDQAPGRKILSYTNFVFQAQDSNVSVQIGKAGL